MLGSTSGLSHRSLTAKSWVQIPYRVPFNMAPSTSGLSRRPLFGLVINMSAILIPSTTRRSRESESRWRHQLDTSSNRILSSIYKEEHCLLFKVSCYRGVV